MNQTTDSSNSHKNIPWSTKFQNIIISISKHQEVILKNIEVGAVLVVAFFVFGTVLYFFFFDYQDPSKTKIGKILVFADNHWKVCLIILIPLFYRGLRKFVQGLTKVGPFEREKPTQRPKGKGKLSRKNP